MSDPTDTLRARVEQAQALAAAATPGPWHVSELDTVAPCVSSAHYPLLHVHGDDDGRPWVDDYTPADPQPMADADLIAAAPDLVALVTDLWSAYVTRAQDASVAVARACLERDEARKERDAALAEVARLRGEAEALGVADGRGLVWVQDNAPIGSWHLCRPNGQSASRAPYSAWLSGRADAYPRFGALSSRTVQCVDTQAACRQIAEWARADGRTVPPHPLGWDVGVSDAG